MSDTQAKKTLKIALVIESFSPQAGGAERSTEQIACELAARGHDVTIVTGHWPRSLHQLQVPYKVRWMTTRRSSSVFRLAWLAYWLPRQLVQGRFDVSMSINSTLAADVLQPRSGIMRESMLRQVAMRSKAASRFFKWLTLRTDPKRLLALELERRVFVKNHVKRYVAIGKYMQTQMQEHYDVPAGKISLIPNAAVMPQFEPSEASRIRTSVRKLFSIDESTTAFLFPAMDPRRKGFGPLLAAFAQLCKQNPNVCLMLAGDFNWRASLAAAKEGVRDRVKILGKTQSMAELYLAADAMVLPTFYDPASKVVIEALMMGCPAISTAFNGASDLIVSDDGTTRGIVLDDPADVPALTQAMQRMTDKQQREMYAKACEGLHGQLSMKQHVDALEQVLLSL